MIKVKGANRPLWCHSIDDKHILYFTIGTGDQKKEIRILDFCSNVSNDIVVQEMLLRAGEFSTKKLINNSCIEDSATCEEFPIAPDIKLEGLKHGLQTFLNPKTDEELDQIIAADEKIEHADDLKQCKFSLLKKSWPNINELIVRLDHKQKEIIKQKTPLLLQGVAGSGKTTILVHKAYKLAQSNQGKKKILIVVYTNFLKRYVLNLLETISLTGKKDECIDFYTWRELCEDLSKKIHVKKFNWIDEIERIALHLKWHRKELNLSDKLSITDLLEIIRAVIKGRSVNQPLLTFEEFKKLNLKEKFYYDDIIDTKMIYQAAVRYQNYLDLNKYIDDMDAARYLMNKLYKLPRWDFVLIDEIQDYTLVQIRLLTALSKNCSGLVFLGDEHQVVYPSLFSWDRVKEAISNVWNLLPPKIDYLNFNYRNPRSVSELGDAIMSFRFNQLNKNWNKVDSNHSLTPKPIRMKVPKKKISEIIKLLASNIGSLGIIFDAKSTTQVSQVQKWKFHGIGFRRAFLPQSVKGIEFDVVCLVNFNYKYKDLVSTGKTNSSEPGLFLMLNEVYVSLTRTRHQLIIIDASSRQDGLWDEDSIKQHFLMLESEERLLKIIPSSYQIKNSAGWCTAAIDFEHQDAFAPAAECWERAGEYEKAAFCYESINDYAKAVKLFIKGKDFKNAARIYERMNSFYNAALSYEQIEEYEKAAECYEKANNFRLAAIAWSKINKTDEAINCLKKIDEVVEYSEEIIELFNKFELYKKEAICWEHIAKSSKHDYKELRKKLLNAAFAWNQSDFLPKLYEKFKHSLQSNNVEFLMYTYYQYKYNELIDNKELNQLKDTWKKLKKINIFQNTRLFEKAGYFFYNSQQYTIAGENFEKAKLWKKAGACFQNVKLWTKAAYCYEKVKLWQEAGECFEKDKQWQKAGYYYEKSTLWLNAGNCFEKAKLWQRAGACFEKVKLWKKVGECFEKDKQWQKAGYYYEKDKQWHKAGNCFKNAGLWQEAGDCFLKAGQLHIAGECFENAKQWRKSGFCYKEAMLWEKAGENYERAEFLIDAAVCYTQIELWDKAGILYKKLGLWEDADRCFAKISMDKNWKYDQYNSEIA